MHSHRALAWLVCVSAGVPCAGCAPGSSRPNLIVICADTLRADYLGFGGFQGPVSPALDRLAQESIVFENGFTQAPWTKPATASLLTSLYPSAHGLTDHEGGFWSDSPERRTGVLSDEAITLAEVLREAGYRTSGFTANSWLLRSYGFAQGFDVYDDYAARLDTPAEEILRNARGWLNFTQNSGKPFFLYLHFMDVHAPYHGSKKDFDAILGAPSLGADAALRESELPYNRWNNIDTPTEWATDEVRNRLAYWRTRYASGVRTLDRQLAEFVDELRRDGVLEDTVLVFTSDHGEHLFEHGDWSHGQNLYDHQLRIPFLIRDRAGNGGGRRVSEVVELVDVMPTVLSMLGVAHPEGLQGRDLSAVFRGAELAPGASFATAVQRNPELHSVRTESHKLIVDRSTGRQELYDVRVDPDEQRNIAELEPDLSAQLRQRLEAHLERLNQMGVIEAQEGVLSPEELQRLEALGYQ